MMIKRLVLLLLLMAGLVQVAGAAGRDPYAFFFDETWHDFHEELQKARAEGKSAIMLFFEMDECPFCHRMKTTVLNQPEVQEYFKKHFLSFPVDIEGDVEMVDFQGNHMPQKDFAFKINRVRATPVIAFYDLEGNQIMRYTGATKDVAEFLLLGEFIVSGAYKEMKFTRFKRERTPG